MATPIGNTRDQMKIVTSHIYPPIPTRAFDWCATFDNYDGPGSPIGYGSTEQEAIENLKEISDV
jgi:hypothetical protein